MPTGPDLPSTAMLMRIAADHGLDLTTADADSYRSLMAGAIESYRRLEAFSEPKPPLSVPATAAGGRGPRTTRSTVGTGAATSRARRAACTGSRSGWTAHPPTSEHSRWFAWSPMADAVRTALATPVAQGQVRPWETTAPQPAGERSQSRLRE